MFYAWGKFHVEAGKSCISRISFAKYLEIIVMVFSGNVYNVCYCFPGYGQDCFCHFIAGVEVVAK